MREKFNCGLDSHYNMKRVKWSGGNQLSTEVVEDKVVLDYSCKNCNSQNSPPTPYN
jgi:hypothetical protein